MAGGGGAKAANTPRGLEFGTASIQKEEEVTKKKSFNDKSGGNRNNAKGFL